MLIRNLDTIDLRFPTSRTNAGTDAMHPDPDYSAAYVILETDGGLEGHGFTFTIGRGHELCAEAIRAFRRPDARIHHVGPCGVLAIARVGVAAPLAEPRERRDSPRDGGHRQRRVGFAREARAQARVEAAGGHVAARDRPVH